MSVRKEYTNGEITIVWQPQKCIHSGVCVKTLPQVYDPKARPWITLNNATSTELIAQIEQCPSGALSYYKNGDKPAVENVDRIKVEVMANGPLLVHANLEVTSDQGTNYQNKITAFCRCGASANKPYCDGRHKKIDFKG